MEVFGSWIVIIYTPIIQRGWQSFNFSKWRHLSLTIPAHSKNLIIPESKHTHRCIHFIYFPISLKRRLTRTDVLHISESCFGQTGQLTAVSVSLHYYHIQSVSCWLLDCFEITKCNIYRFDFSLPQLASKRTTVDPAVHALGIQEMELISSKKKTYMHN